MSNFGLFQYPPLPSVRKAVALSFLNKTGTLILPVAYALRLQVATPLGYAYRIRSVLPLAYSVGAPVRAGTAVSYGTHVGTYFVGVSTPIEYAHRLRTALAVEYAVSAPIRVFFPATYGPATTVRQAISLGYGEAVVLRHTQLFTYGLADNVRYTHPVSYGDAVRTRFSIETAYGDASIIRVSLEAGYYNLQPVRAFTYALYDTRDVTPVRAATSVRYVSNPYALVSTIDGVPSVVIDNVASTILGGSVFIDEGEGVWRGNLTVSGMETYAAARLGSAVYVTLGSDTYLMFVDSRSMRMSEPAQVDTEISLVSSGAFLSEPRASTQDVFIPSNILASQLATQLAGVIGLDWLMADWTLLGGAKEWLGAYPMSVIKEIAEAAGGVVDALPSGRLVVRPKFPVSPTQYTSIVPDAVIYTTSSALSVAEEHTTLPLYGSFRIMDIPNELSDRLEYVADTLEPLRGQIFAYPQPYRTSIELVSTSDANIIISAGQWTYREEEEEIEIVGGEGTTKYPIVSVVSSAWNDLSGGQLGVEYYRTKVRTMAGVGYGLLRLRYRTVALVYSVSSAVPDTSQFLLQEV